MDVGEGSTDLFEDENTTKNSAPIGHKRSRDLNSDVDSANAIIDSNILDGRTSVRTDAVVGDVDLEASGHVRKAQRLHIQKSGGTAFALALKSECICNDATNPRPQKGYCKSCPHVMEDKTRPPTILQTNLWTHENETYFPPYAHNCSRYKATGRFFGFQKRNRTYSFYSLNRLTTGWPCGVHVGYARLRMCCNRLKLHGVRHSIVTLFREPLARLVSEYYQSTYNRLHINSWDWCAHPKVPYTLAQFFNMDVSYPFQNRVTKMLSGSQSQASAAGPDWNEYPEIRKRDFDRAVGVLKSTEDFFFGMAERLDETLELFEFVYRRRFVAPSPCHAHQNSTPGESCEKVSVGLHDRNGKPLELSSGELADFKRNNWEDVYIYEEAGKIFDVRMKAFRELQELGSDFAIDQKCQQILEQEDDDDDVHGG